jgi:hypothetical protein
VQWEAELARYQSRDGCGFTLWTPGGDTITVVDKGCYPFLHQSTHFIYQLIITFNIVTHFLMMLMFDLDQCQAGMTCFYEITGYNAAPPTVGYTLHRQYPSYSFEFVSAHNVSSTYRTPYDNKNHNSFTKTATCMIPASSLPDRSFTLSNIYVTYNNSVFPSFIHILFYHVHLLTLLHIFGV